MAKIYEQYKCHASLLLVWQGCLQTQGCNQAGRRSFGCSANLQEYYCWDQVIIQQHLLNHVSAHQAHLQNPIDGHAKSDAPSFDPVLELAELHHLCWRAQDLCWRELLPMRWRQHHKAQLASKYISTNVYMQPGQAWHWAVSGRVG
jgi:hypothetical protein